MGTSFVHFFSLFSKKVRQHVGWSLQTCLEHLSQLDLQLGHQQHFSSLHLDFHLFSSSSCGDSSKTKSDLTKTFLNFIQKCTCRFSRFSETVTGKKKKQLLSKYQDDELAFLLDHHVHFLQ